MLTDETSNEEAFQAPEGSFSYLDTSRLIKSYPALNKSYVVVRKGGFEYHLFVFDHGTEELILKDEVKGILKSVYPIYETLMAETFKEEDLDCEKIAFGIALAMNVFETYKEPIIHFRCLHTYAFTQKSNLKRKYPLGLPTIPKDHINLGFIYQSYDKKGEKMYSFDGYIFPEKVMEILFHEYEIIEKGEVPMIHKGKLTDVWKLKGRS